MMEYRPFGATGLEVSVLGYGAGRVGEDPDLADGVAPSLIRALEGGVNLVDAAGSAAAEAVVGSTLRAWPGTRPLIATTVRPALVEPDRMYRPLAEVHTPASIRASVEASLQALGGEALDIVHLGRWRYLWTHEPAWLETLGDLRAEGKLRFIAVSALDHEHDALLEVVSRGAVDAVQATVNLFESRPLDALLPLARARGVGVTARGVLDGGGLSGALTAADFAARAALRHAPFVQYASRLAALEAQFTPEQAGRLDELAVRFAISQPGVSAAVVGMPRTDLVARALAAVRAGWLSGETVREIRRAHIWSRNFYERHA